MVLRELRRPARGVVDAVVLHGGAACCATTSRRRCSRSTARRTSRSTSSGPRSASRTPTCGARGRSRARRTATGSSSPTTGGCGSATSAPRPVVTQDAADLRGAVRLRVPQHLVQASVYDHVAAWVADGTAPPSAAPITLTDQTPRQVVRDERGLGLGGVRLAAGRPDADQLRRQRGPGLLLPRRRLRPVDDATLAAWYPDAEEYRDAVVASTSAAVGAGFVGTDVAADPPGTPTSSTSSTSASQRARSHRRSGAGPGPHAARAGGRGPA